MLAMLHIGGVSAVMRTPRIAVVLPARVPSAATSAVVRAADAGLRDRDVRHKRLNLERSGSWNELPLFLPKGVAGSPLTVADRANTIIAYTTEPVRDFRRFITMNIPRLVRGRLWIGLLAAAVISACNGGIQGTPTGTQSSLEVHRMRSLLGASTIVRVFDSCCNTIYGSVPSANCMTVSPSPLPSLAPGDHKDITLTTQDNCGSVPDISVAYGPGRQGYTCTLTTTYGSTGFTYSVTNGPGVACYAKPAPPMSKYDESFTWAPCLSNCFASVPRRRL